MVRAARLLLVLLAPLVLTGCLFAPGKFESTLTIHADRSFAFSYTGEIIGLDTDTLTRSMAQMADKKPDPAASAKSKAEAEAKFAQVATLLRNEPGYRRVEYRGNGVFFVDYAISGRLRYNFVYPFNQDAAMIFPFVAIELRGNDMLRVKAPGFAKADGQNMGMGNQPMSGMAPESKLDGTFTLTTDAAIVSQNNEKGASDGPGRTKVIQWRATPLTKDAPMAVLKVAPLD